MQIYTEGTGPPPRWAECYHLLRSEIVNCKIVELNALHFIPEKATIRPTWAKANQSQKVKLDLFFKLPFQTAVNNNNC